MDETEAEAPGRVALVTGASRGIGLAIAETLGRRGVRILGVTRTKDTAARAQAHLDNYVSNAQVIDLDLAQPSLIQAPLRALFETQGWPDILIHNAGITCDQLLVRTSEADWARVMNTNLTSFYALAKLCLKPMLKQRWGRIIGISSVVARLGNAGQTQYGASKAGVEGFIRSLAQETASRNICVNAVAPGFIETDMTQALTETQRQGFFQQIPMGRLGRPEEVANLVDFLASDQAAYITGTVIPVSGGMPGY